MGAWQLQVDLRGFTGFEPGKFRRIAEGAYEVTIKDSEIAPSRDPTKPNNLVFQVTITEPGEARGVARTVYVGGDLTKDGNKNHLAGLLLCIGATQQEIDSGILPLNDSMFRGKTAYIYSEHQEGKDEKGRDLLDNTNFVAPNYYRQWKATHQQAAGTMGVSGGGPRPLSLAPSAPPPSQPAQPGANGTTGGGGFPTGAPTPQPGFSGGAIFGQRQ